MYSYLCLFVFEIKSHRHTQRFSNALSLICINKNGGITHIKNIFDAYFRKSKGLNSLAGLR